MGDDDLIERGQGALLGHQRVERRRDPRRVGDRRAAPPAQAGDGAAAVQPARARPRSRTSSPASTTTSGSAPRSGARSPAACSPASTATACPTTAAARCPATAGWPSASPTRPQVRASRAAAPDRRRARLLAGPAGDRLVRGQPARLHRHHRRQQGVAGGRQLRRARRARRAHPRGHRADRRRRQLTSPLPAGRVAHGDLRSIGLTCATATVGCGRRGSGRRLDRRASSVLPPRLVDRGGRGRAGCTGRAAGTSSSFGRWSVSARQSAGRNAASGGAIADPAGDSRVDDVRARRASRTSSRRATSARRAGRTRAARSRRRRRDVRCRRRRGCRSDSLTPRKSNRITLRPAAGSSAEQRRRPSG